MNGLKDFFFFIACRDFRFLYCDKNDKNLGHKRNIGFGVLFLVWGIFLSSECVLVQVVMKTFSKRKGVTDEQLNTLISLC